MKDEILFVEKQRFGQNGLLLIALILINGIFIWGFVQQVIFGIAWGNNPMSDLALSIVAGSLFLFCFNLLFSKLQTIITEEGIYVRFLPIDFKTRFYAWEDIDEAYVRKYSPLREFGGWGARGSWKRGVAYNVSGSIGLQLVLENGRKILIGTNRAEELQEILKKINGKRKQK